MAQQFCNAGRRPALSPDTSIGLPEYGGYIRCQYRYRIFLKSRELFPHGAGNTLSPYRYHITLLGHMHWSAYKPLLSLSVSGGGRQCSIFSIQAPVGMAAVCSGDGLIRAPRSDGNRVIIRFYSMEGVLLEGIGNANSI